MGSCKICGKELSQDSFVMVESIKESRALASFHATLTRKDKIKDLIKRGNITKEETRCFECVRLIFEEIDRQVKEAEFERDSYLKYVQDTESETLDEEKEAISLELKKFAEEELFLLQEVEKTKFAKAAIREVLEECYTRAKETDLVEDAYWTDVADYQYKLHCQQEEHQNIVGRNQYGASELRKLEQKNVYQDTFYISTSGRIGTINNFRLGRLQDTPVEWEEINAAWGQATLLLYIISKKGGFNLKQYRLRPMGNRSTIEETTTDKVNTYDLWGSEDLGFGGWFFGFGKKTNNSFDTGMVAFLQCLKEICENVEVYKLEVPYIISGDKIGNQSIRMQSTTEELWTKALKHVLTNLNFLLAWTSNNKK